MKWVSGCRVSFYGLGVQSGKNVRLHINWGMLVFGSKWLGPRSEWVTRGDRLLEPKFGVIVRSLFGSRGSNTSCREITTHAIELLPFMG